MTRSLCVTALCALFSLPVNAGSVEFAQWIPWEFLSQEIRKQNLSFSEAEGSVVLNLGELKPVLKNLALKGSGSLQDLHFNNRGASLTSAGNFSLDVGAIMIDQIITREFGGNVIQVVLKAECSSVRIEIPSVTLHADFLFREDHGWLPVLNDLSLSLPQNSWKVSAISCSGLSGVGKEIESTLNEALKNSALFSPLIRAWLTPVMDEWIYSQWIGVNGKDGEWENLTLDPPEDKGFLVRGELPLESAEDVLLPANLPEELKGSVPKFFLARDGFRAIIQDRLRAVIPLQYDLRQNDSFRKLMNSRVTQFLVWPDLRRFNSSTPFVLKTNPSTLNLGLSQVNGAWKADLSGRGSLVTVIGGSPIEYILYSMSLALPVQMVLKDGSLLFSTGKAEAKLVWSFGYLYQMIYKPENRIPVSILTGALASLASNKSQDVNLPRFTVGEHAYQLSNLESHDQLVTMDWL